MAQSTRPLQVITRLVDGSICAYDLAADAGGVLSPAMICRPSGEDDVVDHAVAEDLQRAYYTTLNAVVCVTADGIEVWRSEFEPQSDQQFGHRPSCVMSLDGLVVWVYRPDAMAGRNRPDQWVALDAGTGAVIAQADLDAVGHGGQHLLHPAGDQVFLDVGEGQDGSVIYRASVVEDRMDLIRYPWNDRCLIDLAPDGRHFMTVDHEQTDVAIHTCPDGEVTFTFPVDAFGHDPDEVFMEWSGGYLNQDTVIVTLVGETEDEQEWFRHYRVDVRSGQVQAAFDAHAENPYDIQPLGDGSWLTADQSGHPIRWTDA
ncbi:hypothetical protein OG920_45240 [Streptomyces europaeiscabiei]|uniref:hypothetical protein n=1 Tax=Streptomyces TaxID=1883 RepID=UPI000A369DF1|nr:MULTISPECIES: hypothetical protein [Streptomyces]MDX3636941.1 hypothetical protein [Streptomyces europaeiscabiei]MDX3652835.1 hypothetical protein [Streptomyces europaeiscabiei]